MTEVPCPECGATLEGPYEGRIACQACGCILIFEGDTVRIVQKNHVKQIILGTKTQTRRNHNNVEDRAQQKKEAAFNQLHGPSRPNASPPSFAGRKPTGAGCCFPFPQHRCDTGPRRPSEKSMGDAPSPRQWGAAKDQRKGRGMNSNACEVGLSEQTRDAAIPRPSRSPAHNGPYGVSSRDTAPSAGGLPAHQMARRGGFSSSRVPSEHLLKPSEPILSCPPDCPSKKFCDPSSCALESVREANAIVEALRRAK